MTTPTTTTTAGSYEASAARAAGPLLVAVHGRAGSAPALKAARLLTTRFGGGAEVVAVLESFPVYYQGLAMEPLPPEIAAEQESSLRQAVRQQVASIVGEQERWPIEIVAGQPARTIARLAHERNARMIVLGLGRHAPMDRLFGSETALYTIRAADRPVLAVVGEFATLPRHAVVAIDFSPASVRAAEETLALLEPGGTLTLVHVRPRMDDLLRDAAETWNRSHNQRVEDLFRRLVAGLRALASVTVRHLVLAGDPADEVLAYAQQHGADLVATGSSGAGFFERLRLGSVATRLLRHTTMSLLAVPRPSAAEAERIERQITSTQETSAAARWPALVETFSRRNVGRPTRLEIDDPAIGAQLQESGYVLLGATYDHRDGRLELMLGDAAGIRTLAHGIAGLASIAVLTDPDGRDRALRAQHGAGQTILTFAD